MAGEVGLFTKVCERCLHYHKIFNVSVVFTTTMYSSWIGVQDQNEVEDFSQMNLDSFDSSNILEQMEFENPIQQNDDSESDSDDSEEETPTKEGKEEVPSNDEQDEGEKEAGSELPPDVIEADYSDYINKGTKNNSKMIFD